MQVPNRKALKNNKKLPNNSFPKKRKLFTKLNPKPIIAVLTQPSPYPEFPKEQYSHIASSYVKGIEAAGGHVIPIKYDDSKENINEILKGVNGIFLTGGGTNLKERNSTTRKKKYTQYGKTAKYLISYAKKENRMGKYFPLWGTCLGFELMMMSYSGKKNIIQKVFGMVNHLDTLIFINVKF